MEIVNRKRCTTVEDNLIDADLLKYKDFVLKIGQGKNGEISMPNDNSFDISLQNLSKSACINLSELTISKSHQLGLQKITVIGDDMITEFDWGGDNPLPIKHYATRKICQPTNNISTHRLHQTKAYLASYVSSAFQLLSKD